MKVKFTDEDLLEMCQKRLDSIECPCEGYFELSHGPSYEHCVVATFVPGRKPVEEPLEPAPMSALPVPMPEEVEII
jgi:hypothetical protein